MTVDNFSQRVLSWYDEYGRKHLPWQQDINPYRVWLSEIMLQQTQVATVIDYFQRFTSRFPDVQSLADAPLDDVLALWAGLGYYSRAKNLHKAAQMVCDEFAGNFPRKQEDLELLPGVGRSTAAAIRSIAFEQPAAILDGNVKRVLARHQGIGGWPGQSKTLKALWQAAENLTPQTRSRAYTQVMMDLGATVCTRTKPKCATCPIQHDCLALADDRIEELPGKKPKKQLPIKATQMLYIVFQGQVLLLQRPLSGIWPGLFSLPEIAVDAELNDYFAKQLALCETDLCLEDSACMQFRHTFSHYHLDITVQKIELLAAPKLVAENTGLHWYNPQNPAEVGVPAPVSKIFKELA